MVWGRKHKVGETGRLGRDTAGGRMGEEVIIEGAVEGAIGGQYLRVRTRKGVRRRIDGRDFIPK